MSMEVSQLIRRLKENYPLDADVVVQLPNGSELSVSEVAESWKGDALLVVSVN